MKNILKSLVLLLFLFGFVFVIGCGDENKEDDDKTNQVEELTVTFVNDGSEQKVTVKKGEKVSKPSDPVKDGYVFLGWYLGDNEFSFDTVIDSNIKLEAKFEEVVEKFTVTFKFDTETKVEVEKGKKVSKTNDPEKEGYKFIGWYLGDLPYNFNAPVTNDITLVAKFEEIALIDYTVVVNDIAGKPLSKFYVEFYLNDELVSEGYTDNEGFYRCNLEANNYEVVVEATDEYYLNEEMLTTDLIGSAIEVVAEINDLKGIIADKDHTYNLGDVMYDFTLKNTEDKEFTLYELLAEKELVILNFWYTTCSACQMEFPAMVEAYNSTYEQNGVSVKYSDKVAIIAINPSVVGTQDSFEDIKSYKQMAGLPFDVCLDYDRDSSNLTMDPALTYMFGVKAYPTTVVIDRYGLIVDFGEGAVTLSEKWIQLFDKYIGDNYTPVYTGVVEEDEFIKPDITQEESSVLEEAINGTNYDGSKFESLYTPEDNNDKDYSWPWIVTEYKGKKCIKPSNTDVSPSFAIVYTTVTLKAGEVFTFDYFASSEEYDKLYITANGVICTSIAGQSPDWETSYAFVAVRDGEYEIGFCYLKDSSYSIGEDSVFVTNVRIVRTEDIDKETYIFREAADGQINEFTHSYTHYVDVVYNEDDGYYHVNDENGPLLLADMLSSTQWNNSSIYEVSIEGNCIGYDGVDYNDLIEEYAIYASNSEIGYTPVTKELADALKQLVKALGHELAASNENQWLELCVYYSAYGTNGKELGLPIIGVAPFVPIMFEGDALTEPAKADATFNRIILPRGFIFGFTPVKSGVYKFYSTEETLETVAWVCDDKAIVTGESEQELRLFAERSTNDIEADNNFVVYKYLEAGETYLFRAAFYDPYEYSKIHVEMIFVDDKVELLTLASPSFFTSSDDEMNDIISGNHINITLGDDGYYHVLDSKSSDNFVYCDFTYINGITGYPLLECLSERFNSFDFSKDEYGQDIFDEEGYYRVTMLDENYNMTRMYVCYDQNGEYYNVSEIGEDGKTVENGYTYVKFTAEQIEELGLVDFTEYVQEYINANMVTDENSELYGCVKVDEKFASVLSKLMDKYTFEGVEESWLKLCYYYKYVGE